LISSMGPYLDEFATLIDTNTLLDRKNTNSKPLLNKNPSLKPNTTP